VDAFNTNVSVSTKPGRPQAALAAADWLIVATSLTPAEFSTTDVLDLYRLRWRVELGFKRLKSLVGLQGAPGTDDASART